MNNNYCVYVHIVPNGKRYYGMTKDIKRRWKNDGYDYRNNIDFYEAIQLYGWDNIEHLIIADNLTKEEAELLEEELIRDNKTYESEYGYNRYIGRKLTNEYKEAISGENSYFYGRDMAGVNNPFYSKHHSEETKAKMSEAKKGANHPKAKPVICTTTNMIFNTLNEASNYYGICRSNICTCCRGKKKSAGKLSDGTKLVWRYITIMPL